jgi:hypothetical protein
VNEMNMVPRASSLFALLALCLTGLSGCQTTNQPGAASHASVQIQGHSPAEIRQAATAVFSEAGYSLTTALSSEMVFDRPGSAWDEVKWGGLLSDGVTMRVKIRLSEIPGGSQLLQADAYVVEKSDNPFFQTETRKMLLSRHYYRRLLNDVASRLK